MFIIDFFFYRYICLYIFFVFFFLFSFLKIENKNTPENKKLKYLFLENLSFNNHPTYNFFKN